MKIIFSKEQLQQVVVLLKELDSRQDVKEFNIMYNPILPSQVIVRYKTHYTTEDGAIAIEIVYRCVDTKGNVKNCQELFGGDFYTVLRDYTVINLNSPSIEVI